MGRVRTGVLAALIAALLAFAAVAFASSTPPTSLATCTDHSTACLDAVAMSYVNAIGTKNPSVAEAVRAAPNVQRWENGLHNVATRSQLVAELKNAETFVADIRDVRLFVGRGGQNVFAMYLVDAGLNRQLSVTAHVIERFGISHGLITQIEVVQCDGGPGEVARGTTTDITGTLDVALCVRANPPVPAGLARDSR